MFVCHDCEVAPMLIGLNGRCGDVAAGEWALLGGGMINRCPVAEALDDPDVAVLANLVPSPQGEGLLAHYDALKLPPRYRNIVRAATSWRDEWREAAKVSPQSGGGGDE